MRLCRAVVIVERATVKPLKQACDVRCNLQLLTGGDHLAQTGRHVLLAVCLLRQMLQSDKRKKQSLHTLLRNHTQQLASIASRFFSQQHERAARTQRREDFLK